MGFPLKTKEKVEKLYNTMERLYFTRSYLDVQKSAKCLIKIFTTTTLVVLALRLAKCTTNARSGLAMQLLNIYFFKWEPSSAQPTYLVTGVNSCFKNAMYRL